MTDSDILDKALDILKYDNLLITGSAGTGKSYLTKKIISEYQKRAKSVISLGSTGISAVNIGGFTIHSFFAFGISSNLDELIAHDKKNKHRLSQLKSIISKTDLIVIDEISMVSANLLDMIRYRLESMGFCGKILMVGDFYQLPPVIKQRVNSNLFSNNIFAFESDAWNIFSPVVIELTVSKRTKDKEFANILSKIRKGILDNSSIEYFTQIEQRELPINTQDYTKLYSKNIDVNRINIENIHKLPGKLNTIYSQLKSQKSIHQTRIDKWKEALPINDTLELKIGTPLLFTINKWGKYYNGERGVLVEIDEDFLIIEKEDRYTKVERYEFELLEINSNEIDIETKAIATISQFPIKPAYAITIHKSQGMGIENLICNIDSLFAPSQFYVAISRAVDPKNLYIEYNGDNFKEYLKRVVNIDKRVLNWEESIKKRISE